MFETLQRLWNEGRLSITNLKNAVVKSFINEQQYKEICGEDYVA